MQIIYLDMCAASCLAIRENDNWPSIRAKLVAGATRGTIACPMPYETLIESAPCTKEQRIAIDTFFRQAAGGMSFRSYDSILIESTIQLVRPHILVTPYGHLPPSDWAADENFAATTEILHKERIARMKQNMESYVQPTDADKKTFDELLRAISGERCGKILKDLKRLARNSGTDIESYEMPWMAKEFIDRRLCPTEMASLCELIRYHHWENIPVNAIDLLVGTYWAHDYIHGYKNGYKPNDEIDRWRAAVALAHADVFVTDGYTADLCRRPKVRQICCTATYSVTQSKEFEAYLTQTGT